VERQLLSHSVSSCNVAWLIDPWIIKRSFFNYTGYTVSILTLQSAVVSIYIICFNVHSLYILLSVCILRTNSDYFPEQLDQISIFLHYRSVVVSLSF
jgi:hypothetical protein